MVLAALVLLAIVSGCADSDGVSDEPDPAATLKIASFNFPESQILAELYAQAAESVGIPVIRLEDVGPREVLSPAIEGGLVDLVPEYLGAALEFAGGSDAAYGPDEAVEALAELLDPRGLVVLDAADAEDVDVFVVTAANAHTGQLVDISDLIGAGLKRFGGPAECRDRPLCLAGLNRVYGLTFDEFVPQSSLMFTTEALRRDEIDVGLLFSTSPELEASDIIVLNDNLGLQPAQNIIPVMRRDALDRWGPDLAEALNDVSAQLTTSGLRELNRRVDDGEAIADVARAWITQAGLVD